LLVRSQLAVQGREFLAPRINRKRIISIVMVMIVNRKMNVLIGIIEVRDVQRHAHSMQSGTQHRAP
jgi:hypothetical protein